MAFFPLSGANGTVDLSPNAATKAVPNNIAFATGPFENQNGSFFFSGINNSYVEIKNNGKLDTRFSISVFAWVHIHNSSGLIYKYEILNRSYGCSLEVFHQTLGVRVRFMDRKTFQRYSLCKRNILEADKWNFIGTTYDYHTGTATIFVNNSIVTQQVLQANMELATASDVLIGATKNLKAFFRGRISCLQIYNQALTVEQIIKIKAMSNQTGEQ